MSNQPVVIDYMSKDFEGFRQALLDHATRVLPEWTDRSPADFGVMMVELFAYMGDILSYYGDRIVNEAYLETATQRESVLQLAQMLGYRPSGRVAATGTITFETSSDQPTDVLIPAGTKLMTGFDAVSDSPIFYETDYAVTAAANGGKATVSVTQGETRGSVLFTLIDGSTVAVEEIGTSDGLPGQEFALIDTPVLEGTVRVFVDNPDPASAYPIEEYREFTSLLDATDVDKAFETSVDAREVTTLRFGDGIDGVIPASGLRIWATYRVGGGAIGNLAANKIQDIATPLTGVQIFESSEMTGGADAESLDQIRVNAPRAYQTQNRAVTLDDFQDMALGVAAVSKAQAVANTYSNVTVFIVGPNGQEASQALREAVRVYLEDRAMAGTEITVQNADIIPVNIGTTDNPVLVAVRPNVSRGMVRNNVLQALQNMLAPDQVDFGERVALSDVYRTISQVEGVDYAAIPVLARDDAVQSGTADVVLREWEVPTVGNIVINATGGIG